MVDIGKRLLTLSKTSGTIARVRDAWETEHLPVLHSECPSIAKVPESKPSMCYTSRTCLCDASEFKVFVKQWQSVVRSLFKKGTSQRKILEQGVVIACLHGIGDDSRYFLAVSFQNLTTWGAQVARLHPNEDSDIRYCSVWLL
jgi:hypothetical protein